MAEEQPNQPPTEPVGAPAAKPPEKPPEGQAPPARPAAPEPTLAEMLAQSGDDTLSPDQAVTFEGTDGKPVTRTLGELAKVYSQRGSVSDKEWENASLFLGAMANDTAAAQKLVSSFFPGAADTPQGTPTSQTADPRVEQLLQRIEQQGQQLAQIGTRLQVVDQLDNMRTSATLAQLIDQNKAQFPRLAVHPNRGQIAQTAVMGVEQQAKAQGINLANHPQKSALLAKALRDAEQALNALVAPYVKDGQTPLPGQQPPSQPAGLVDDQVGRPNTSGMIQARLQYDPKTGALIDTRNQRPAPQTQTIPNEPTSGLPAGQAPGAPAQQRSASMTTDELMDRLRAQSQARKGGVQ